MALDPHHQDSSIDEKASTVDAVKPKKEKKDKVKYKFNSGISKETIGLIRTNLRNNVGLTKIADNKANVLLSLNALMLTFTIPFMIPLIETIKEYNIVIPVLILILSSLTTIFLAVIALRPGKLNNQNLKANGKRDVSPFFFGNFSSFRKEDYFEYLDSTLHNDTEVITFLSNDFYHLGLRLGEKMRIIRIAFNIFITGLSLSVILAVIILLLN